MTAAEPRPSRAEQVAELMAQHGAARYADVETIAACLPPAAEDPARTLPTETGRS